MSNYMNYENAEDIFSDVKDYIDSHIGPGHVVWTAFTILANGWDEGEYSLENTYPYTRYDISGIVTAENATEAQRTAWREADCGGYESENVIVAHGTVPEIDIPVMLGVVDKAEETSGDTTTIYDSTNERLTFLSKSTYQDSSISYDPATNNLVFA